MRLDINPIRTIIPGTRIVYRLRLNHLRNKPNLIKHIFRSISSTETGTAMPFFFLYGDEVEGAYSESRSMHAIYAGGPK